MASLGPTTAEVDLRALRFNLHQVQRLAGPGREILAVVKADAYGHGAAEVARCLAAEGVSALGVATVEEGAALRRAGLRCAIVVLGAPLPEVYPDLLEWDLVPTLSDVETARSLASAALEAGRELAVQVKVDTGMGRLGLAADRAEEEVAAVASLPGLRVEGVFSHFADADLADPSFSREQLRRFLALREGLERRGVRVPSWHLANSAAVMVLPEAGLTGVRPGIMLYGYAPAEGFAPHVELRPVLTWRTRIVHLKEVPEGTPLSYGRTFVTRRRSRIATLAVGYADGYPRSLSNRGRVLVRGRAAPVVGRVTMDMTLADVTEVPEARVGDPVTLIGRDGGEVLTAWDLARWAGTIAYEILCGIGPRVPRVYRGTEG